MLRYDTLRDLWISNKNTDDTGMPTTNLEKDTEVCGCLECNSAITEKKGTNWKDFPKYYMWKHTR